MTSRMRAVALALSLVILAIAAPSSLAAYTLGPTDVSGSGAGLTQAPGNSDTYINIVDPDPARLTAPFDGVVVRWSARVADTTGDQIRLRRIRPVLDGRFTFLAADVETVPNSATLTTPVYQARMPIKAGEILGMEVQAGTSVRTASVAGARHQSIQPSPADGSTATPAGSPTNSQMLYNATLEPDADKDNFGDETQDLCPSDATRQTACAATGGVVSDTKGPKVSVRRKTVKMSKKGVVPVAITCGGETGNCRAAVTLDAVAATLARSGVFASTKRATIQAGKRTTVKVKLSRKGRRYVARKKRVKVRAIVTLRDAAGNTATSAPTFTVKAPKAKKRKRR